MTPLANGRALLPAPPTVGFGSLWKAFHSDPYG